jgi:diguanylate cyclase (GGDEF)-like protein
MRDSPITILEDARAPSRGDRVVSRGFSERTRENVFAPYRERILYPVAATATVVLLPLAVHHLLRGRVEVGGLLLLLVAMLGADAIAIARRKRPPVPFALLLMPGAASVLLSLPAHPLHAAMWSYPMVLFGYFVLPRRLANIASLSFLGMVATLMGVHEESGTTLRFAASLGFCVLVVNIILNVVDSMHARLLEISIVDPLTGAFNRRHMDAALADAAERWRRNASAASILVLDVDRFKSINDRHGHAAGDAVLRDLARLVRERARRLDSLFRMGGEEFLLLLPETRLREATIVAEWLRAHVAAHCRAEGERVTVSIGIAQLAEGEGVDGWLRRADDALYRAKREGRDRVSAAG